ncbi:hypothetical protein C3Y92_09600 [Solidesulfovibrio carbinolicus]|uniref:Uncharacterized protein n=2 Tax=Solidesulfovibrio carbinolicus TaxID=296842 RepID=A0A4P6HJS2_9BACT|nr:hypothetical protein C3Y92_09600 [Solidesulfovibrio carbinolicus]
MNSQPTTSQKPELKNSDSSPVADPKNVSVFSETTSTENKTETKAKKTPKRKRAHKITVSRDAEAMAAIDKDLDELKKSHVKIELSDKQVIEQKIDKILELKESGVGYEAIHRAFQKRLELQISTKTFVYYVQAILNKDRPKRDPKTVQISVPKEFAGKFEKLVDVLERGLSIACLAFNETEWKGRLDIGTVPDVELEFSTTVPTPEADAADSDAEA